MEKAGNLSDMADPQEQFFKGPKYWGVRSLRGPGTAPELLHPEEDIIRSAHGTITGGRLPGVRAGCAPGQPGECLERLQLPGPPSRTTEIIFWFYEGGNWAAERWSNLITRKCCQRKANQHHYFNSKNVYFFNHIHDLLTSKQLFVPMETKNGTKHHRKLFCFSIQKNLKIHKDLVLWKIKTPPRGGGQSVGRSSSPPGLSPFPHCFPSFIHPLLFFCFTKKSHASVKTRWILIYFSKTEQFSVRGKKRKRSTFHNHHSDAGKR